MIKRQPTRMVDKAEVDDLVLDVFTNLSDYEKLGRVSVVNYGWRVLGVLRALAEGRPLVGKRIEVFTWANTAEILESLLNRINKETMHRYHAALDIMFETEDERVEAYEGMVRGHERHIVPMSWDYLNSNVDMAHEEDRISYTKLRQITKSNDLLKLCALYVALELHTGDGDGEWARLYAF